jgi:hypothetical protein
MILLKYNKQNVVGDKCCKYINFTGQYLKYPRNKCMQQPLTFSKYGNCIDSANWSNTSHVALWVELYAP